MSPYWDPTPFHGPPFFKTMYIKLNRGFGLGKIIYIQGQFLERIKASWGKKAPHGIAGLCALRRAEKGPFFVASNMSISIIGIISVLGISGIIT